MYTIAQKGQALSRVVLVQAAAEGDSRRTSTLDRGYMPKMRDCGDA